MDGEKSKRLHLRFENEILICYVVIILYLRKENHLLQLQYKYKTVTKTH